MPYTLENNKTMHDQIPDSPFTVNDFFENVFERNISDSDCSGINTPTNQLPHQKILKDVIAYVEVRSNNENRSRAIEKELCKLGAVVERKISNDTTHVVFKDGKKSTRDRASKRGIHLVNVLWVDSCKQNQAHVSEDLFPLASPDQAHTPIMLSRLKKGKSMQPKDFDEEVANSAERLDKRRKRLANAEKKRRMSIPYLLIEETQPESPGLCPPSLHDKLNAIRRAREEASPSSKAQNTIESSYSVSDSPVCSQQINMPLERRLFDKKNLSLHSSPEWDDEQQSLVDKSKAPHNRDVEINGQSPDKKQEQTGNLGSQSLKYKKVQKKRKLFNCGSALQPAETLVIPQNSTVSKEVLPRKDKSAVSKRKAAVLDVSDPESVSDDMCSRKSKQRKIDKGFGSNSTSSSDSDRCTDKHSIDEFDVQSEDPLQIGPSSVATTPLAQRLLSNAAMKRKSLGPAVSSTLNDSRSQKNRRKLCALIQQKPEAKEIKKSDLIDKHNGLEQRNGEVENEGKKERNSKSVNKTNSVVDIDYENPSCTRNIDRNSHANCETMLERQVVSRWRSNRISAKEISQALKSVKPGLRNCEELTKSAIIRNGRTIQKNKDKNTLLALCENSTEDHTEDDNTMSTAYDSQPSTILSTITKSRRETAEFASPRLHKTKKLKKPSTAMKTILDSSDSEASTSISSLKSKSRSNAKSSVQRKRHASSASSDSDAVSISCGRKPQGWKKVVIISPNENQKPKRSLAMTNLHYDEQDIVLSVVKKLGGFCVCDTQIEWTSHVICGSSRRTLNVLQAIARGCWLVSLEWVMKSLEAGMWVDEEPYELSDDFPAAQESRLERFALGGEYTQDLFSKTGLIFVAELTSPPHGQIVNLIKLCSGKVTLCARKADLCVGVLKPEVTSVSEKWVLDCITQHCVLGYDNYLLGESLFDMNPSSPQY